MLEGDEVGRESMGRSPRFDSLEDAISSLSMQAQALQKTLKTDYFGALRTFDQCQRAMPEFAK